MRILPGRRYPLGASWDGDGVNFAVYAESATRVVLCLYDRDDPARETACIALPEHTAHVWHGYVPGLGPGQRYGFRAEGAYDPERGKRFNPAKLLIDPYARALAGEVQWRPEIFGYEIGHPEADLSKSDADSAPYVPKGIVLEDEFDWEGDRPLNTPWHRTVIYEAHVKGLTMRHPEVPEALRGTYAGLAQPPVVEYLQQLGVTAVELLIRCTSRGWTRR